MPGDHWAGILAESESSGDQASVLSAAVVWYAWNTNHRGCTDKKKRGIFEGGFFQWEVV